jgi:hypothetical protein
MSTIKKFEKYVTISTVISNKQYFIAKAKIVSANVHYAD